MNHLEASVILNAGEDLREAGDGCWLAGLDLTILVVLGERVRDRYGDNDTGGMERGIDDTGEEDNRDVHTAEAIRGIAPSMGEAEDWPTDEDTEEAADGVGEPLGHPTELVGGT